MLRLPDRGAAPRQGSPEGPKKRTPEGRRAKNWALLA